MKSSPVVQSTRTFEHQGRRFKVEFTPCTNGSWTLTAFSIEHCAPGYISEARPCLVMEGEDADRTFQLLKSELCGTRSR